MKIQYLVLALSLTAVAAQAGNSTVDVAIGGAIGGAVCTAIATDHNVHSSNDHSASQR